MFKNIFLQQFKFLDKKLSVKLCVLFWVVPRRVVFNSQRFGTLCLFHLHRRVDMKCSETSAIKHHMPGNNPKEYTQHLEHGESLKSRSVKLLQLLLIFIFQVLPLSLSSECRVTDAEVMVLSSVKGLVNVVQGQENTFNQHHDGQYSVPHYKMFRDNALSLNSTVTDCT
jgi:hypothetical protein